MNPSGDMDAPVTRRELREELQLTRHELREELVTRREFRQELGTLRKDLDDSFRTVVEKQTAELDERFRQHVNVVIENQRREIGGLDDKYSSLPAKTAALEETVADLAPRVAVLEHKVFAPRAKRPAKRAAGRRR